NLPPTRRGSAPSATRPISAPRPTTRSPHWRSSSSTRSRGSAGRATTPPTAWRCTPARSTAATARNFTGTGRSCLTSATSSAWSGQRESSRTRSPRKTRRSACATRCPPESASALVLLAQLVERDQLDDLVRPPSARRLHLDLVSDRLAHQGAPDRRRQRDLAAAGVDLLGKDDLVRDQLVGVGIDVGELHPAAVGDDAVRDRCHGVHRQLANSAFQLPDSRADEVLPMFRRLVLRFLGQIGVRR